MDTQISLETLLTILNIYPEVELLNQMVIWYLLIIWGTAIPSSIAAVVFHSPTNGTQESQYLYHHQHLLTLSFMLAHYVR